ncbi:MAG: hypothetical protein GEU74_16520 [Nitriliruptorales bacterium]|nr:hypothetical protein [Nitriliruptorales bacterium]
MGAIATMSAATLTAEPGGEASGEITVRNSGSVVDQFDCEVVGDAAGWAVVEPPTVSLFPGAEERVTVRFNPPRDYRVRAGAVAFGVKITPQQDPEGSTVEEGIIEVTSFVDTTAELLPRTTRARGRRRARHELALDNRGNAPVKADLHAADADEMLTFSIEPPELIAEPGQAVFARVGVRAKKRFWRGQPQTHPFQVVVEPRDGVPLAVDGTMLQEAVLPKWLPKALLALLLLAALLVALWFALLRPALESAARTAAEEEAKELRSEQAAIGAQAAAAEETAAAAEETAAAAEETASEIADSGGGGGGDVPANTRDLGDPFDFRLARSVVAGAKGEAIFTVPNRQTLSLTDILLQNPSADRGVLQVVRRTPESDAILLEVRLENFRDLDYHFVSPVVFQAGNDVVAVIDCKNKGAKACNAAAYFSGFVAERARGADSSGG